MDTGFDYYTVNITGHIILFVGLRNYLFGYQINVIQVQSYIDIFTDLKNACRRNMFNYTFAIKGPSMFSQLK